MSKYTAQQTIEMLEGVVEGREDYVYEYATVNYVEYESEVVKEATATDCLYATPDGAPSCIVGQVLAKHEPELFDSIREMEYAGYNEEDGFYLSSVSVDHIYAVWDHFEADAVRVLSKAQETQDRFKPWGVALEEARKGVADGARSK